MKRPLLLYLESYLKADPSPFHTPGHKGKWGDIFEIPGFDPFCADIADDIADITAKIRESENLASKIYGTRRSLYLVNGSTSGIQIMFLATLKPGDKVIIGRNMHRSAVSAMITTGAIPVYVQSRFNENWIPLNVTPEDIETAIIENPDCKAVYVTSPTGLGICADVEEISRICRKYDKLFLVDGAWEAHFPFHRDLPPSAIESGADMVVQSVHKTLASLSGTSILHVCNDRIDINKVESAKRMVETTSPNLLYYLSIENAVVMMAEKGEEILSRAIEMADSCREGIRETPEMLESNAKNSIVSFDGLKSKAQNSDSHNIIPHYDSLEDSPHYNSHENNPHLQVGDREAQKNFNCFNSFPINDFRTDPTKLILSVNREKTGISGIEVAERLKHTHGVEAEMSSLDYVVFIFTGFETDRDVDRLRDSIDSISGLGNPSCKGPNTSSLPGMKLSPRDAYFRDKEMIPLSQSPGRISAEIITPYPPGIPLLVPGEELTCDVVDYINKILNHGGNVRGLDVRDEGAFVWAVVSQ
ncbi:MAG: aminotransferase class V-fold PLP-dependent enzyme [Candidatus Eremiobacteraeota bacterium]|nr:aminotransferase class V-fold PLP-dependent enzyme [Candidatus Eremiobacteraeota bacterium]